MTLDLNALATFTVVAEERSFRAAADRLGVTRSAVSQTIRRLEDAMGVALVHRTTRSVGLTEAGERLHAEIAPSLVDIRVAVEAARHLGQDLAASCALSFPLSPRASCRVRYWPASPRPAPTSSWMCS